MIITSKYDLGAKVKLNTGIFCMCVERIRMQNVHSSILNTFIHFLSKPICHRLKRMVFAVTIDRAGITFAGMVSLVLLF